MILARQVLDGEAKRSRLLIEWIGAIGRVRLASLCLGLGPSDMLRAREGQKVPQRRSIDKKQRFDQVFMLRVDVCDRHSRYPILVGPRSEEHTSELQSRP